MSRLVYESKWGRRSSHYPKSQRHVLCCLSGRDKPLLDVMTHSPFCRSSGGVSASDLTVAMDPPEIPDLSLKNDREEVIVAFGWDACKVRSARYRDMSL